jgi:hypothetical protein
MATPVRDVHGQDTRDPFGDLLRAMAARESRYLRASTPVPLPIMRRWERGISVPLRLVAAHCTGIASKTTAGFSFQQN